VVLISGSSLITTTTAAALTLNADAYVSLCKGNISRTGLEYTWTAYTGEDEDLSLVSTSKQYYSYKLDPYKLAVNGLYTFKLNVLDTVSLESSSNSVQVNVEPSDLVAVIRGGGTQAVLLGNSITLDASSSYDSDVAGALCDRLHTLGRNNEALLCTECTVRSVCSHFNLLLNRLAI
jgi:REJ domain